MHGFKTIAQVLTSTDTKIRRQIIYWAAIAVLWCLGIVVLWFEVSVGDIASGPAVWLTVLITGGEIIFYGLIRFCKHLGLSPSQLAFWQGHFTIICMVFAYAISGEIRGSTLTILLVNIVFCASMLKVEKTHKLSIVAIVLLGAAMIWMVRTDPTRFKLRIEVIHFFFAATALVVVAYLTGLLNRLRIRLKEQKEELADALTRIQLLATRDELTSLANRHHMSEILENEERRHNAQGRPVCIAMIDLDLFKQINDTHGHAAGDTVLRAFAQLAKADLRTVDVMARWGGEEFLLMLPDTNLDAAKMVLERLKVHTSTMNFPDISPDLHITFSAGLIALLDGESIKDGISRADQGMYQAKSQGRNCIVVPQS